MEEHNNPNLIPLFLLVSVMIIALGLIFVLAQAYWDEEGPGGQPTPVSGSMPLAEVDTPAAGAVPAAATLADGQPSAPVSPTASTASPTTPPSDMPVESVRSSSDLPATSPIDPARVEELLSSLTMEQKIGQMIMDALPAGVSDPQTRQRIVSDGLGGVIFLNVQMTPDQLRQTTQTLQAMATQEGSGIPLFFAWNHEGGRISRLGAGLTEFPSNMALGVTHDQLQLARAYGQAVGEEMSSLGVNMNYAPVLDVNTEPANPIIGLRAFGDDPATVAALGSAYIEGLQEAGVIAVAKHFPGHGGVDIDSHVDLPVVTASRSDIEQIDLPPFDAALDSNVGAVMVAHLQIPDLDPSGRPSSLSSAAVTGILRQQMEFDGLIMTDAIGMGAITDQYGIGEAAVMAIEAGNDMVLTVDPGEFEAVRSGLLSAIGAGRLTEARIDDSVRRILALKLAYDLIPSPETPVLGNMNAHLALSNQIADQAVTIDQDTRQWLPLDLPMGKLLLITPNMLAERHAGSAVGDGRSMLNELLSNRGIQVSEFFYDHASPASIGEVQNEALAQALSVDAIVVITWDAYLQQYHAGTMAQPQMINSLLQTGKPVIVVYGQLPYDKILTPDAPAQITMYGDTSAQLSTLVSRLLD
jgi:beta-N-acetylhexosaminidase